MVADPDGYSSAKKGAGTPLRTITSDNHHYGALRGVAATNQTWLGSNPLLEERGERRTSAQQIKIPFEEIASSSSRSGLGAGRPAPGHHILLIN